MKRLYYLLILPFVLLASNSWSQTSISANLIDSNSFGSYCAVPATVNFFLTANAIGYTNGTMMDVFIYYGDGDGDTLQLPLNPNLFLYTTFLHSYVNPGTYSVSAIVRGPDLNADTILNPGMITVTNTCDTVSGYVFKDLDADCTMDIGELPVPAKWIQAEVGGVPAGGTFTDASGYYVLYLPTGTAYDLHISGAPDPAYCPSSGTITGAVPGSGTSYDFGYDCLGNPFDLSINYMSGNGFRPGFNTGNIYLYTYNLYCPDDPNPSLTLTLDPLTSFVSATPAATSVVGNTVTWNFASFSAIPQFVYVNLGTSLTAQIGDTVCFQATLSPTSGDANAANNSASFCIDVRNSWDPNMKVANPAGVGPQGLMLPQQLEYTVHFQNTGNDVAYNVAILDTIDADLDMSTFKLIGASHPMQVFFLPGNIIKFDFPNIMLLDSTTNEPASHGSVVYTIDPLVSAEGTVYSNTAYIYFDFNEAIITNTTVNTIHFGLGETPESATQWSAYPVPVNDVVNVSMPLEGTWVMHLTDMTGRNIMQSQFTGTTGQLNMQDLPAGVYVLQAESAGVKLVKLIEKN